ncbi:hypothetical protein KP509_33G066500 [Ceratopteris richardii]|uniref:C2H2-type domain-containing protein n=1 Tax=Ceratopteris richardii TaxID=49495 RepID=A0A8T2QQY7_CERRI|nr:hypothetical protein KP509_33G066500 [Ceratopteris richardii]
MGFPDDVERAQESKLPSVPNTANNEQQACAPKWFKQWVPCDTVLNPGKLTLLKWVTEDMLKALEEKNPEAEKEPEEEYELLYLCTFEGCGKSFTEQSALRKHSNVHGEKQFICHYDGCGKRFMDSSKLKRHFLTHTGERHFICPVDGCGKAFSLDFNLRSHMRTHTQENYHVCPFEDCGKRYAHEYKLRAHLRTYHEKVVLPDVKLAPPPLPASLEKEIKLQKTAVAASTSASLDRPFACPYAGCDKRYIHEYKLNLHLRKEHANESLPEPNTRTGRHLVADEDMDEGLERDPKGASMHHSSRGKFRFGPKAPTPKPVHRKWPSASPSEVSMKMPAGHFSMQRESGHRAYHADSEETEEEDGEDTEDESVGRMMHGDYEEDEQTEDDMD